MIKIEKKIPRNQLLLVQELFSLEQWVECVKKSQRPLWVDPQIMNCHLCEKMFKKMPLRGSRQHHCRRCGVAVC